MKTRKVWSRERAGHWFILAAAMLWGTTGTAQTFAPQDAQPEAVGAIRLAIGGLALLALAIMRGALRIRLRWPILLTLLAAGSMAAYQPFFFAAVARTGVAVGTIIGIGSAPIIAGTLGYFVRREPPGRWWAFATILAVLGSALLVASNGGEVDIDRWGIVLALAAGTAYAVFTLASKQLLEGRPLDAVMAVVFCLGAVMLTPVLFTADLAWLAQPNGLAVALHLGLFATAMAYSLFVRGLAAVPVGTATTLSLAEPLTAGTLGLLVLNERLTTTGGFGFLLVVAGLALISLHPEKLANRAFIRQ